MVTYSSTDWNVRITFESTGNTFEGRDATEALQRLAETQWTEEDRANIKRALAWRFNVSGGGTDPRILHELMSDDEFLHTMHKVNFALVEWRHSASSNDRAEAS